MNFHLVLVVSLVILVGSDVVFAEDGKSDVEVGPLLLIDPDYQERPPVVHYGRNRNNIRCPTKGIDLSNVHSVVWEFGNGTTNLGTFTWSPEEPAIATGSLKDMVNLERSDHHLELLSTNFDLSGFYKCIVNVPGKKPLASEPWELIVYKFAKASFASGAVTKTGRCEFFDSFSTPAIFPQPTINYGIYSLDKKEFVGPLATPEIIQWPNGSYSYSFIEAKFKITPSVPYNIKLRREVGFTKKDGTYIRLNSGERPLHNYGGVKGCRKLCHWDSAVVISYTNYKRKMSDGKIDFTDNCRGEMRPWVSDPIKAHYSCKKGYRPNNNLINQTKAICNGPEYNWIITGFQPIDFHCEPSPEQPSSSSCFSPSSIHIIYFILLLCIFIQ